MRGRRGGSSTRGTGLRWVAWVAALALAGALVIVGRSTGGPGEEQQVLTSAAGQAGDASGQPVQRRFEALVSPLLRTGPLVEPTESVHELRVTLRRGSVAQGTPPARLRPTPA